MAEVRLEWRWHWRQVPGVQDLLHVTEQRLSEAGRGASAIDPSKEESNTAFAARKQEGQTSQNEDSKTIAIDAPSARDDQ